MKPDDGARGTGEGQVIDVKLTVSPGVSFASYFKAIDEKIAAYNAVRAHALSFSTRITHVIGTVKIRDDSFDMKRLPRVALYRVHRPKWECVGP